MGTVESKPNDNDARRASSGDSSDDDGDWMQADKYAKWVDGGVMDYNAYVIGVSHVEMPLQSEEYSVASGITHEALVFEVLCTNGQRTKYTVELTVAGVLKRWGHHTNITRVKNSKIINLTINEVIEKVQTKRKYNLVFYNCKTYAAQKFKEL